MVNVNKLVGLSIVASGCLALAGPALADSTWGAGCSANCSGTTVGNTTGTDAKLTIGAYYADKSNTSFVAGDRHGGSTYIGVLSSENGVKESANNEPHHAMDNYGRWSSSTNPVSGSGTTADDNGGADYAEMVYLSFNKSVSLINVTSNGYFYQGGGGDADFQVYAYIGTSETINFGSYTADALMSTSGDWKLVAADDFSTSGYNNVSSKTVGDGSLFSSYWVVTTALGASTKNDSFKLKQFTAIGCAYTVSGGECKPPPPPPSPGGDVPEPSSLALFVAAAMGAGAMRRRRSAMRQ